MSDLDKLMKKLKKDDPKAETPEEKEPKVEELEDDEDEEDAEVTEQPTDPVDPIPANVDPEHTPEAEVGLLQNNGIFRRELLLIKKEQVDVLKVIAQTLLDIKSKLVGEEDGKKD